MNEPPDLHPMLRVVAYPHEAAVEIGGRGELLEFVFGEDEAVEAVGRTVIAGEMLRLPQDETEMDRPLLLPQQTCLIADGEEVFKDRPFRKRLGVTAVDPCLVAAEAFLAPEPVNVLGKLSGVGMIHCLSRSGSPGARRSPAPQT